MTSTDARRPAALPCSLRLAIGGALIALMSLNAQAEDGKTAPPPSPDILLGPLFNDVQSAKLFADQKTFADAIPNSDPLMILADYRMQKNQASFDLRHFVELNFTLPKENDTYVPPKGQTLRQHIDGLWPVLTRSTVEVEKWDSLLPLPKPYVVPGGRFREVYYWDSYFTMLGLAESGHWDKVEDMVANFAAEIDAWGHIPNGNRTYYLSRSQPPFFSFMVSLLATHDGDQVLKTYQPQLEKEYRYWMAGADALAPGSADKRAVRMADGALLNRYWDDNDTPRPESWLDDVKTAKKQPESSGNRDLSRPALRRRLRLGFQLPLDGQSAAARHHSHHLDCPGRSQCPDVPSGENPRPRQQGIRGQRWRYAVRCAG
ncbi:Trehalase [Klebsiella pneumoniae]|uniref:Trehalase n=1 Tax=Klebsiella pneumoniae TaxID=573 RepID=A0A377WKC3_KLEPN|nr:Trehalase [Klebsiella pneumoniae]